LENKIFVKYYNIYLNTVENKQKTYRITVNVKGIVLYDETAESKCGR